MKPTLALKKIIVIGPESTGKSTLSGYLADYYSTLWCPEFAREYLLENGTAYTIDDLITIAKGQLQAQTKYTSALQTQINQTGIVKPLIIDTSATSKSSCCHRRNFSALINSHSIFFTNG